MIMRGGFIGLSFLLGLVLGDPLTKDVKRPLNLAHRGSSGMFPEHTRKAYVSALEQGADYIECDVVITSDLQLICSHEPWISETSNVADHSGSISGVPHTDFSDRLQTYDMNDDDPDFDWNDKGMVTDYFSFDFTLEEIMELRRKQVKPNRDPQFDWQYGFVTFDEFVEIAKSYGAGIYPEIKQPTAINRILSERGIEDPIEDIILRKLSEHGMDKEDSKVFLQCFELSTIKNLREKTDLPRIFLVKREPKFTEALWEELADSGIVGIGAPKSLIIKTESVEEADPQDPGSITLIDHQRINTIHSYGLMVHLYTFRNEWTDIPWDFGKDPFKEYEEYTRIGIDGFFTDFPATLTNFLKYNYPVEPKALGGGGNSHKGSLISSVFISVSILLYSVFSL
uniref:glycerophosphodiester phosphodiesterase n=1 Tax=Caligus rogercresseyi TaxID=217165 RepID=C1BPV1_CALRO|nr:Glycerophosphoryl diester phosphodiesterase precursor [Caligus rogercresseyi]|eukprot:TRINITY_DN19484_c0_g1_i1.p1 TRINITY_DN19484_c0_g1~~TRINITY_DN19484_c0_g1_i1.p1  ORF type:complete len:397 (+),score=45.74 TRINITY_DN19484_c0_g1_i1:81-1271(+)